MIKTIKVKKEFTFRELLQWIIENDVSGRDFMSKDKTSRFIIDESGNFHFGISVHGNQTYEIDVEEEITDETEFNWVTTVLSGKYVQTDHCMTLLKLKDEYSIYGEVLVYALINGELVKIWERYADE